MGSVMPGFVNVVGIRLSGVEEGKRDRKEAFDSLPGDVSSWIRCFSLGPAPSVPDSPLSKTASMLSDFTYLKPHLMAGGRKWGTDGGTGARGCCARGSEGGADLAAKRCTEWLPLQVDPLSGVPTMEDRDTLGARIEEEGPFFKCFVAWPGNWLPVDDLRGVR